MFGPFQFKIWYKIYKKPIHANFAKAQFYRIFLPPDYIAFSNLTQEKLGVIRGRISIKNLEARFRNKKLQLLPVF